VNTLARSLRIGRELARIGSAIVAERLETGYVFNPLLNPLLRQARDWPYPLYQRLRERDAIHRSRAIRGWFLFRHADCLAVLRDGRFSADDRNYAGYAQQRAWEIADGLADANQPDEPPMLRRDPPDHTRLRKLVSRAFTPRALEQLRSRVEELADRLLTPLARRGEFDVIRDFAVPFPVTIIAEMLGIPARDFATFKRWSDHLVGFLDPLASPGPKVLRKTVDEFDGYMSRLAEERRREPAGDLLTALVQADEQGQRLSAQELQGTLALLLAAATRRPPT
jgi:cytochrome P450